MSCSLSGVAAANPWTREAADLGRELGVDTDVGLPAAAAATRLTRHGPNEVELERDLPLWRSVLGQLRETMILVLLGAAVLTAATGDVTDTIVILLVVLVNTTVGVAQERKAVRAVAALRQLSAPSARVLRDGVSARVPTRDLVPGDVLLLATGDVVGADARLVRAHELQVDEALLTGESLPSDRATGVLAAGGGWRPAARSSARCLPWRPSARSPCSPRTRPGPSPREQWSASRCGPRTAVTRARC